MFALYIFGIIIPVLFAAPPCQHGLEILSEETKNLADLIGNWTSVYQWGVPVLGLGPAGVKKFDELIDAPANLECPQLYFEPITPEFVKAKKNECSHLSNLAKAVSNFDWDDAKLKVAFMEYPNVQGEGGVIIIGEKENWLVEGCFGMARFVFKKVSDDYMVMINTDYSESNLIVRNGKLPSFEELKCLVHSLDVGKGISGIGACHKKWTGTL